MNPIIIAIVAFLLAACSSDPIVLPDPTTGASSSSVEGSGGMGGQGGIGGQGGEGGEAGSGGAGGASMAGDGSGTRLRRKVYTSPDGLYAGAVFGSFRDTVLNIDCAMTTVPGGSTRCMPGGAAFLPGYEDAACTVRGVRVHDPCGTVVPAYATVAPPAVGCNAAPAEPVKWYHAGAKLQNAPTYYKDGAGVCLLYPMGTEYSYFSLGAEVDYSAFAPMALGVE